MTSSTAITLATLSSCLEQCIELDIPTFIWGPPGVGKSETVRQVAKRMRRKLIDIRLGLLEPVDLRGLPVVDHKAGTSRWLPPRELPNEERDGKCGILFLDEANVANQAMQGAAMGLVLDRRLGEYQLPPGWVPVAAGNRVSDKAAAQRLTSALRNRFAHFEVEASIEAWRSWALGAQVHPLLIAFLSVRPELLHVMPKGDENAFPTPRSWMQVAKVADLREPTRQHLVSSLVGPGPAAEFENYARSWQHLPSLDDVVRNPKTAKVPPMTQPSVFFLLSSALAHMAEPKNIKAIVTYVGRLPKEFEVRTILDAAKRTPSLTQTAAYASWAAENQDELMS